MTNELYEYLFSVNIMGMVAKVTIPEHSHVAEIQLYGFNDDDNNETSIRYMITVLTQDTTETYQLLHRYDEFLKWFNKELHIEEKLRGMYVGQEISDALIQQMETTVNTSIWSYNNIHEGENSVEHMLFAMLLGEQSESKKPAVESAVYVKLPRMIPEGEVNPNIGKPVNNVTKVALESVDNGEKPVVVFSNLITRSVMSSSSLGIVINISDTNATIELNPEFIGDPKIQYLLTHLEEFKLSVVYYYEEEINSATKVLGYMIEWMKPNSIYPDVPQMNILLHNIAEGRFRVKITAGATEQSYHVSILPNTTSFWLDAKCVDEFTARYRKFEDIVLKKSGLEDTVVVLDPEMAYAEKLQVIQDIYTKAFTKFAYVRECGIINEFLNAMGADRME